MATRNDRDWHGNDTPGRDDERAIYSRPTWQGDRDEHYRQQQQSAMASMHDDAAARRQQGMQDDRGAAFHDDRNVPFRQDRNRMRGDDDPRYGDVRRDRDVHRDDHRFGRSTERGQEGLYEMRSGLASQDWRRTDDRDRERAREDDERGRSWSDRLFGRNRGEDDDDDRRRGWFGRDRDRDRDDDERRSRGSWFDRLIGRNRDDDDDEDRDDARRDRGWSTRGRDRDDRPRDERRDVRPRRDEDDRSQRDRWSARDRDDEDVRFRGSRDVDDQVGWYRSGRDVGRVVSREDEDWRSAHDRQRDRHWNVGERRDLGSQRPEIREMDRRHSMGEQRERMLRDERERERDRDRERHSSHEVGRIGERYDQRGPYIVQDREYGGLGDDETRSRWRSDQRGVFGGGYTDEDETDRQTRGIRGDHDPRRRQFASSIDDVGDDMRGQYRRSRDDGELGRRGDEPGAFERFGPEGRRRIT